MPNIGAPELIIILVVVLLLFGGTKLAGLGKSTGRALREFKEETKGLRDKDTKDEAPTTAAQTAAIEAETVDAEVVEPTNEQLRSQQAAQAESRRDA